MKEKPTVGSPFFRAFPSDFIPKAMKEVNVHFFLHSYCTTGIIYTSKFRKLFEATTYADFFNSVTVNQYKL